MRVGGLVEERGRFTRSEILGVSEPQRYVLRHHRPLSVVLRHRTRDLDILEEIFLRGIYEFVGSECGHGWGPSPGEEDLRIIDLGGHIGLFGLWCLSRWPGSTITSYEADPSSFELLARTAGSNGGARWDAVHATACNREGEMPFLADGTSEAHIASAGEAATLRIRSIDIVSLLEAEPVDLLKIDIEGGEWALLTDPRFARCRSRLIVLEHHGRHSPSGEPRKAATELLEQAGYRVALAGEDSLGVGILLALRTDATG